MLRGRWGCGAAFLREKSKTAGVKWSLVKCVKGMPDPGALIAGTGQSLPGPRGCSQGAGWEPEGREVSDLFAKNPSEIHPRPPFSSSPGCCLAASPQLSFSWTLIPVLAMSLYSCGLSCEKYLTANQRQLTVGISSAPAYGQFGFGCKSRATCHAPCTQPGP